MSPFFRLPAELRNKIFGFALTAPEPLYYRKPSDGSKEYLEYIRYNDLDDDLDDDLDTPAKEAIEFNQLKYVNKQLYTETAGLELQYNDVVVCADSYHAKPAEQLIAWLSSMSPAKMSWINTITITFHIDCGDRCDPDMIPETVETLVHLTRLCNACPTMTVRYELPAWSLHVSSGGFGDPDDWQLSAECFVEDAIALRRAFRGESPFPVALLPGSLRLRRIIEFLKPSPLRGWRKGVPVEELRAQNLLYVPCTVSGLEEYAAAPTFAAFDSRGNGLVMEWVEYARMWAEYGV